VRTVVNDLSSSLEERRLVLVGSGSGVYMLALDIADRRRCLEVGWRLGPVWVGFERNTSAFETSARGRRNLRSEIRVVGDHCCCKAVEKKADKEEGFLTTTELA
jgi:hypothetical protein